MKKVIALVSLFFAVNCFAVGNGRLDKQQSCLELVEKNYNKFAYVSAGLLLIAAGLNADKIQGFLNGYYQSLKPYFNQKNAAQGSLAMGLLFAVPLVYYEYNKEKKDKNA